MAQDRHNQQALHERADALVAEQQALLKQLQQLQRKLQEESDAVHQLNEGGRQPSSA
jgi:predicted nuclease with TOPRIM domain